MQYMTGRCIPTFQRKLLPPSPGQMPKNLVLCVKWVMKLVTNINKELNYFLQELVGG